jgi:hypothetical protein
MTEDALGTHIILHKIANMCKTIWLCVTVWVNFPTAKNKVLFPQVVIEFHPISYIQGKNSIKGGYWNLQLFQARFRQKFSMAKFIKGGNCKLNLTEVKLKCVSALLQQHGLRSEARMREKAQ